jgi:hypothetical protein
MKQMDNETKLILAQISYMLETITEYIIEESKLSNSTYQRAPYYLAQEMKRLNQMISAT